MRTGALRGEGSAVAVSLAFKGDPRSLHPSAGTHARAAFAKDAPETLGLGLALPLASKGGVGLLFARDRRTTAGFAITIEDESGMMLKVKDIVRNKANLINSNDFVILPLFFCS
ncbi:hypothetical protein [Saccharibacillus endophyticus]|uniref:Uncharacterized protein n=1 Tax=Saccharibacillus endophyticus TaxID=2060666 RepID=A0ABQ1ZV35_9BACL|nr:hypothetical protein [Saccharibacillus endophyticus]GGH80118.1 hypothetical protein GCM10007362_27940 [Saccharibacillus endophyticus]